MSKPTVEPFILGLVGSLGTLTLVSMEISTLMRVVGLYGVIRDEVLAATHPTSLEGSQWHIPSLHIHASHAPPLPFTLHWPHLTERMHSFMQGVATGAHQVTDSPRENYKSS